MKKYCLLLSLMVMLTMACQQGSTQKVTDQEKMEIQQLDSLLNDLVKNKPDKSVNELEKQ